MFICGMYFLNSHNDNLVVMHSELTERLHTEYLLRSEICAVINIPTITLL